MSTYISGVKRVRTSRDALTTTDPQEIRSMAAKSNTTAEFAASVQNASRNAKTGETAAIEMRGYVMTEDNDLALKDLSNALEAVATLCDEGANMLPDLPGDMWAGLLRTFARQATAIHHEAAFANHATARLRADLN